ncbi:MAG: DUF6799 domain-containing protein [Candidatus Binataceae bacterium]
MAAALLAMPCRSARLSAAGMDGVIMQGGKMMMMKAGKAMDPMTANMTMSNGAVVMPDGTVKLRDGQELHLKDGQMMMMDGTIMDGGKPKPMMKPQGMDTGE